MFLATPEEALQVGVARLKADPRLRFAEGLRNDPTIQRVLATLTDEESMPLSMAAGKVKRTHAPFSVEEAAVWEKAT